MQPGARTLDQIYGSLGSFYDPQVGSINQRINDLPSQLQADESALGAQRDVAYNNITDSARARGMGFSGIPLGEQAKYAATDYLPAVAKLRQSNREQGMSLQDAINQINERRNSQAQSIYQWEQEMDASRKATAAAGSGGGVGYDLSDIMNQVGPKSNSATAVQRAGGGFNYFDANGRPISAATYAASKGLKFRDVLSAAAKAGDKGSQTALGFVGDDYGYDPRKVSSKALADLYNALVWGTGKSASFKPTNTYPMGTGVLQNSPAGFNQYKAPTGQSVLNLITKK